MARGGKMMSVAISASPVGPGLASVAVSDVTKQNHTIHLTATYLVLGHCGVKRQGAARCA